jgi:hypothetical protein
MNLVIPGDGGVSIPVDSGGGFRQSIFDPVGAIPPADTTFDSYLAIGAPGGGRTQIAPAVACIGDTTSIQSQFNVLGLDVTLTQTVDQLFADNVNRVNQTGSILFQVYTFVNNTGATIAADVVRYLDGDLNFIGGLTDSGGTGVINDNDPNPADDTRVMFETDQQAGGGGANTFVGITLTGGDLLPDDPGHFALIQWNGLQPLIAAGTPLPNTIQGDTDGDGFTNGAFDVTVGLRQIFSLDPGQTRAITTLTVFGDLPPGDIDLPEPPTPPSIAGTKFEDLDNDGARDPGEPGLPGWTIFVDANNNGTLDAAEVSVVTDAAGNYNIPVSPGTFTVREVLQPSFLQTFPGPAANFEHMVTVDFDMPATGIDFGNVEPQIGGRKYHDLNGNGSANGGETGLANWTIYLDLNDDGDLDVGEPSQQTDSFGRYKFTELSPGVPLPSNTYVVREINRNGWVQFQGANGHTVNYTVGDIVTGRDFGNQQQGGVGGFKWHDLDEDGVVDSGESRLGGWEIYIDSNGNGRLDTNEISTTTASDGRYAFPNLAPGPYRIREVLQPNWVQTFPSSGFHDITVVGGRNQRGIDFGNKAFQFIRGQVFNDANGNGIQNNNEGGLAGMYVYADESPFDGAPNLNEAGTFTDAAGNFELNVDAGTYIVKSAPNAGLLDTTAPIPVTIGEAQTITGLRIGKHPQLDFGDAPEAGTKYPTTLANNGARHGVVSGFGLGAIAPGSVGVDGEPDGQPSADAGASGADGDDGSGTDDEDGVALPAAIEAGAVVTVKFTGGAAQDILKGRVQGFIDFNRDGDWKDPGEQIFTDVIIRSGTPAENCLTFTVPAGAIAGPTFARFRISTDAGLSDEGPARDGEVEDYPVMILPSTTSLSVTNVGTVGDVTRSNENIQGPTSYYAATASLTGRFAFTASYAQQGGDLNVLVFDSNGLVAQSGAYANGGKKVEFDSVKNRTYTFLIEGINGDANLNFMNLIQVNSPATVVGTEDDDVIRFVAGAQTHVVTVNGVEFEFDAATDTQFFVEGNGGNDSISVVSTDGRDRVRYSPLTLRVDARTYDLNVSSVEAIQYDGNGGNDVVKMFDGPGDETVEITPGAGQMTGDGHSFSATGASKVFAFGSEGTNVATIGDSAGTDKLVSKHNRQILRGTGFAINVTRFNDVTVNSTTGADKAYVWDSRGNDTITASPDSVQITGEGFSNTANGFPRVVIKSIRGGIDSATITDSPGKDRLFARPDKIDFIGAGFDFDLIGIETFVAQSIHGGGDVARFFGSLGNDLLTAGVNSAVLAGQSYSLAAQGFGKTLTYVNQGGHDVAVITGGLGDDDFFGRRKVFELIGAGYDHFGQDFDQVEIIGLGGVNSLRGELDNLDYAFSTVGNWI